MKFWPALFSLLFGFIVAAQLALLPPLSEAATCQYACSAYGYTEGQCYQGWQCTNGCITYNSCTASSISGSSCQFKCSSHGYAEGQCVQGWHCTNGCINYNSCTQSSGQSLPVGIYSCIPSSRNSGTGELSCSKWEDASDRLKVVDSKVVVISPAAPAVIVASNQPQGERDVYLIGTADERYPHYVQMRSDLNGDGIFETPVDSISEETNWLSSQSKYYYTIKFSGVYTDKPFMIYENDTGIFYLDSLVTESVTATDSTVAFRYKFYQDTAGFGTISSPQYNTPLIITLLGKPFIIVGVGTGSIKLLAGTIGTATKDSLTSTGVTSGKYTVYTTVGANNDWSNLQIKDDAGKVVDTITNAKEGDMKTSTAAGLDVKVTDIRVVGTDPATQHIEVDMVAGPTGDVEREYDGTADVSVNSKERFPGEQDLYITFTGGSGQSSAASGTIKAGSSINVEHHTSANSAGTASQKQSATTCQFTCSAYKYSEGQCVQGWQCLNGCISYNSCTVGGNSCQFSCSSYGYSEGQCVQGWKCANGCITYNSCVQ